MTVLPRQVSAAASIKERMHRIIQAVVEAHKRYSLYLHENHDLHAAERTEAFLHASLRALELSRLASQIEDQLLRELATTSVGEFLSRVCVEHMERFPNDHLVCVSIDRTHLTSAATTDSVEFITAHLLTLVYQMDPKAPKRLKAKMDKPPPVPQAH